MAGTALKRGVSPRLFKPLAPTHNPSTIACIYHARRACSRASVTLSRYPPRSGLDFIDNVGVAGLYWVIIFFLRSLYTECIVLAWH